MRNIIIALVFLTSCYEIEINHINHFNCMSLQVSDASPIQFWVNGEETYNEKQACHMKEACFCQEFKCDDDIKLVFNNEEDGNYEAVIVRDSNNRYAPFNQSLQSVQTGWTEGVFVDPSAGVVLTVNGDNSWNVSDLILTPGSVWHAQPFFAYEGATVDLELNMVFDGSSQPIDEIIMSLRDSDNNVIDSESIVNVSASSSHSFSLTVPSDKKARWLRLDYIIGASFVDVDMNFVESIGTVLVYADTPLSPLELTKDGDNYTADLGAYLAEQEPPICDDQFSLLIKSPAIDGEVIGLSSGTQHGSGSTWTIDADPSVIVSGTGVSKTIKWDFPSNSGVTYTISYEADFDDPTCNMRIYFLDSGLNQLNVVDVPEFNGSGGVQSGSVEITPSGDGSYIAIVVSGGGLTHTFELISLVVESAPEVIHFKSDCIKVVSESDCSVLIGYANPIPYAGLDTDGDTYYLRVPGRFYHERSPTEGESDDRSDGVIVELTSSIKKQRLLELKPMPDYMHHKLKLVLRHKTVTNDGKTWKQEEGYDVNELHRNFPLKTGEVYLTEQGSIVRNVYST